MPYSLPDISYIRLRFVLTAEKSSLLPAFKGSMLRGAFGNALKKTVCVMKPGHDCYVCMLRPQCAYTRIFESFIEENAPPFLKGIRTSPRPFVIHEFDEVTRLEAGQNFSFTLTLLGKACDFHPYVIFAFMRAAENGFTVRRHPFRLSEVIDASDGSQVYDGLKQVIVKQISPQKTSANGVLSGPVRLDFLSPVRLRIKGKMAVPETFRPLAFNMLRRTLETAYFHEPGSAIDWDFQEYLNQANQVRFLERELVWEDWTRFSTRQNAKLDMGGFSGHVTLEGDLAPFGPLLKTAEVLHVGKGTVMGMGRLEVNFISGYM